ncbi:MAG: MopE-related protein [Pseudomonadota bacterium]
MQSRPAVQTMLPTLSLLVLTACSRPPHQDTPPPVEPDPLPWDTGPAYVDQDGDGYSPELGDCDDRDPSVHPGQYEVCDGRDENCNGVVDEGFTDTDGDRIADCVDVEECDGRDNDGDGEIDEGFGDADGDGTADCLETEACDGLDNDGDGEIDEGFDADGDGWLPCGPAEHDCDETDPAVHPEATETDGDGRDQDCDGLIDEGRFQAGALVLTEIMANPARVSDLAGEWVEILNQGEDTVFLQGLALDGGLGDAAILDCIDGGTLAPGGYAIAAAEADPAANGGVEPHCIARPLLLSNEREVLTLRAGDLVLDQVSWDDGATMPDASGASLSLDPFCTNAEDNDDPACWCAAPVAWEERSDLGSPGAANALCPTLDHDGDGFTGAEGDCDDSAPLVNPGMEDPFYDGLDQDCDGWSDYDADRDGYDSASFGGLDCNDGNAGANPGLPEVCDAHNIDEDCNGLADDRDPAPLGTVAYHHDRDGDGWGSDVRLWYYCDPPAYAVTDGGDCDDNDAAVSPSTAELCGDAVDDDCDGYAQTCAELSLASADLILEGAAGDETGSSIGPAGNFGGGLGIAVGARAFDGSTPGPGSACVIADPAGLITSLTGTGSRRVALSATATCFVGESDRSQAGVALDGGWDADSDGVDDLLIGALGQQSLGPMTGAAYLLLGPGPTSGALVDADATLRGMAAGDQAGTSLAFAGDLDGDGVVDLMVGAPRVDKSTSTTSTGEVYLLYGPVLGEQSLSTADVLMTGEMTDALAGTSVAGGDDLDGDGLDDFIIGAPGDSSYRSNAGTVYAFTHTPSGTVALSVADAKITGDSTNAALGTSVAMVGDVDGDGSGDFLVGGPGDSTGGALAGAAFLITASPTGSSTIGGFYAERLYGGAAGDGAGSRVSGAGDVDGDGFADLLVAAPAASTFSTDGGEAYLMLGPFGPSASSLNLLTDHDGWFLGEAAAAGDGMMVAPAGDLDADGLDDLLVSAPALEVSSEPDGAAYVLLGATLFPDL